MTFDQQTQTDFKDSLGSLNISDFSKLLALNQQILNEQNQLKVDSQNSQGILLGFSQEMAGIRKQLEEIVGKLSGMERSGVEKYVEIQTGPVKPEQKVLNGSNGYYIIQTEEAGEGRNASAVSLPGSANENSYMMSDDAQEYTIEEVQDSSAKGSNSSRFSYHDNSTMMSNCSAASGDDRTFRRSQSMLSIASNSSTPLQRKNQGKKKNQNLLNQIQKDWNLDENVDDDKEVVIGSNKTLVKAHVLRSIDWENYKQATRKLLVNLFSRETLATRSLTGRPSPAFHDRNKPVKDRLDSSIISDVIQVVTKYCGVQESQVRTAITTKCADENKMYRQRMMAEEKQFKQPDQQDNKENVENR
jgi:hypothetical protein